ncbi:hypothetical protein EJ065_7012 [Corallococcus coralloides]|uniref:Uncharacterized protein n=1 Tax=Corallococcus coralloides TaxID=184914 RepID=A0A410S2V0_CORCK|nr:hypothetical protein [Corallococcus coralloides]QAT88537.1 hypothetical protein EJ065_7012 [Corallococcus coralloides]
MQALDLFRDGRALRAGLGVQRKTSVADFRAELALDGTGNRFHPGAAIDVKLPGCTSAIASLTTAPGALKAPGPSYFAAVLTPSRP